MVKPLTDAEDQLAAKVVEEITMPQWTMELHLRPESVLILVGLVQLAMRHPEVTETDSQAVWIVARRFIEGARKYFAGCPAIIETIDRGESAFPGEPVS
jgi:hypothetical protein